MNLPTAKRLQVFLNIEPGEAKQVRRILELTLTRGVRCEYENDSPSYEIEHDSPSRKLYMINAMKLGYYGVEILRSRHDTQHAFRGISYLNTGDSYGATLLYDYDKGKWILSSWGDVVERSGRRFE